MEKNYRAIYGFERSDGTGNVSVSKEPLTYDQAKKVAKSLEGSVNAHLSLLSPKRIEFTFYVMNEEDAKNKSKKGKTQDLTDYLVGGESK